MTQQGRTVLARIEETFERWLWGFRLIVLVPVIASLVGAVAILTIATVDAYHVIVAVFSLLRESHAEQFRAVAIQHVIEMLDGYLLSTVMLVFAFGLYELFISRIDAAERSELGRRLLLIRDLDDLKDRLAKVILLILVVKFFEHALRLTYGRALDLILLAGGIILVAGGLYLLHRHRPAHGSGPRD